MAETRFPIEEGKKFLRLIKRYDRYINKEYYVAQKAYKDAVDPETGLLDHEKYEELTERYRDGEDYVQSEADKRLRAAYATPSGKLTPQDMDEIMEAFGREDEERHKKRSAEYRLIADEMEASPFWRWLWRHPGFKKAAELFSTKRKFPRCSYRGSEDSSAVEFGEPMDNEDMRTFCLLTAKSLIGYYKLSDEDIALYCKLRASLKKKVEQINENALRIAKSRSWVAQRVQRMLPTMQLPRLDVSRAHAYARRECFIQDVADKYHYNFLCVHADVLAELTSIIDPDIDRRRIFAILRPIRRSLDRWRFDPSRPGSYKHIF